MRKFFIQLASSIIISLFVSQISYGQNNPDHPGFGKYEINKEELIKLRSKETGEIREILYNKPFVPTKKPVAIKPIKVEDPQLNLSGVNLMTNPLVTSPNISCESEPNNTFATANPILTNPAKVKGNVFPNADEDWFSFVANAGDRIYAAVITSASASGSTDSQLRLFGSDGTTLIEFDEDDGTLGGLSSSIAGAVIPSNGTYYLQVKHFSATSTLRGYDLYVKTQSGAPTPEVESNDGPGTANPLPASGWVSGSRNPALSTEQDWFSITLAAGETIFISMDLDPERDNLQWNGRIGVAQFGDGGDQILVVDDASVGSAANPLSEALAFTAKDAGTYYVFADAASAATGGPTATYHISVSTFAPSTGYTSYVSADVPKTIGPGAGLVSSTITIPAVPANFRVKEIRLTLNLNHALMADIDANLTTPEGSTIALFNDIGATATGGQTQMDLTLSDDNAIPFVFTVVKGVGVQPELNYKLSWHKGMKYSGTWTLDLYDDLTNTSGGTLNSWSIEIIEDPGPNLAGATVLYSEDFEATDGGFTHSGTADEWEWGVPATAATTTTNPIAAIIGGAGGAASKCWKTDLDNTYDNSSNQVLLSPVINLTAATGTLWLSWNMKFQMESATFDKITIKVYEEGNPTNFVVLYNWLGATMTAGVGSPTTNVGLSTPWGLYWADLSAFVGKNIRIEVTVETDTSVVFAGLAFDDITIYQVISCTPPTITLGTNPTVCSGSTSANLPYTATTGSPDQYSIDYDATAEAAGFVDIVNEPLPVTPIVLVVPVAATANTYNASLTVRNSSSGCSSSTSAITVTVNPTPNAVATPASQTICSANPITTIVLTGAVGGTTYAWTRDNTGTVTGIAANGNGNISGTLTNSTSAPVTVTFTITPTANGCPGPTTTATVTVNPIPDVDQPANQVVCNGVSTAPVTFTGAVSGTVYNWTNSNPGIGLAANGVGDIPSFNAINTGAGPVVATINVTPQTGAPMAVSFSNSTNILIPATGTSGIANPYPSDIVVSGIPTTGVTIQSITLTNITHTFSDDIEMLLVSPGGQTFVVMADVGGATGLDATATLTIRDGFPSMPLGSAPMPTGTYAPTSDGSAATWPTPAPTGPYNFPAPGGSSTFASVYNSSTNYNGTWKLYVDDDAGGDIGNIAGGWSITLLVPSASNCIGASKSFTYTVNPTPNAVATPSSQTLCANNTAITTIVISGAVSGTTYSWTRNNTATVTGIAASGTGNISGTLNNTTTAPITVTFTITPTANGCPGPTTTATVTVAPTIAVDPVANQTVCNGALTAPVNFTGPAAGTIFNWTNNTPSIGLAASGTGNIAAFTAMNATALPVTATVTVTPSISVVSQPTPELFHYKFDGSGTSVPNLASAPPAGTATATIMGAQTQGGSGLCDGTLIGSGNSSATNFVNTGWATNLTGTSWSISFKTSNITPSTTLFYVLGDNLAGNFRCFTNGVAGANNWMLRGPQGDIIATGGATVAPHTTTFVYDNTAGQLSAYVDGVLVNTRAQAPPTITGAGPFKVGAQGTNTGLSAGGLMDEFRLYNRALTLSEIQSLSSCNTICTGPTSTFTITVNPTPTITCPANITVPSVVGACTAVVTYAPSVTGTPTTTLSYVLTGATTGSGTGTGSGTAFRVGVTTVTITATNICATVSCSFTVTVTDSQLPVITAQPVNRTVCAGASATFSVTAITAPSAGGPLSYQWQLWNGSTWNNIAGATSTSYTVSGATVAMNTNSFRVVVTGLCTVVNSTHATLYVNPLPTINLTTSIPPNLLPTQVLTITATVAPGGGSFVWFKNGVVIAGASGPSLANLTVSDIGTYRAVYTGPNGCVVTSSDVVITGQASDNLYVYPVPNNGQFNVRFYNQSNELVTLRVIDAKGAEVYRKKVQTTIPYTTMNVDLTTNRIFSSGVYIVEIRRADGSLAGSRKIIVYK